MLGGHLSPFGLLESTGDLQTAPQRPLDGDSGFRAHDGSLTQHLAAAQHQNQCTNHGANGTAKNRYAEGHTLVVSLDHGTLVHTLGNNPRRRCARSTGSPNLGSTMRYDRFTVKAREAIADAQALAGKQGNPEIRPQHLLLVLLTQDQGVVASLLQHIEADVAALSREAAKLVDDLPNVSGGAQARVSNQLQNVFSEADDIAKSLGDSHVATEVLFLAINSVDDKPCQLLRDHGLTPDRLQEAMQILRGGQSVSGEDAESNYESLEKYTRDLTKDARDGKIDPVIGRDDEIRRTLQVLSRRTKNNPVLIGEPGVGKTAIVEGIAQRIAMGDVPESLQDKKVLSSRPRCAGGRGKVSG